MTIVVGTETYLSVADADTYWSNRNDSTWAAASTAAKEAALRNATAYIDGSYDFIGSQNTNNVLCWPRYNVLITQGNLKGVSYDENTIPPQVKNATAELARESLSAALITSKDRGGMVKREKVDTIEVEYMDGAPSSKSFPHVTMLLKPLLSTQGNMARLVR